MLQKKKIPFEFEPEAITEDGHGLFYVGKTKNLGQRWRGHLTIGARRHGGQVKHGLIDCGLYGGEQGEGNALKFLRQHGRFVYCELPGEENCANRDILEISLCARYMPPFNIKAER
jgi:hypothetical protein